MSYNQLILLHKCLVRLSTSCLSALYGNHNTHQCITEFTLALVTADPNITTGLRDKPVAIQSGVTARTSTMTLESNSSGLPCTPCVRNDCMPIFNTGSLAPPELNFRLANVGSKHCTRCAGCALAFGRCARHQSALLDEQVAMQRHISKYAFIKVKA